MPKLQIGNLAVEVVRKNIKNLHLAIYPPNGRVRVSVPLRVGNEAVRLAVATRLGWIRRQQKKLASQERQSPREYVSRESHYFLGRRYLLNIVSHEGFARIVVNKAPVIDLHVRRSVTRSGRERIVQEWYRRELKALIPPLIAKWEAIIGVTIAHWGVKKMRTRWGTCNPNARRIWINLELVKKPVGCLEYIVVHEMVHLVERKHNENFIAHMDKLLPEWRSVKDQLNSFPLRHERWDY